MKIRHCKLLHALATHNTLCTRCAELGESSKYVSEYTRAFNVYNTTNSLK